jgi:hypothetical protein
VRVGAARLRERRWIDGRVAHAVDPASATRASSEGACFIRYLAARRLETFCGPAATTRVSDRRQAGAIHGVAAGWDACAAVKAATDAGA